MHTPSTHTRDRSGKDRRNDTPESQPDGDMLAGIRLGLSRVSRLLEPTPQSWPAIHVAGTNGKGSVSSYIRAMLQRSGKRTGSFNSPHVVDRWDCIRINDEVISRSLFQTIEADVLAWNEKEKIRGSSFELLTAIAYRAFTAANVDIAVVECGMGGRFDATNVLENSVATAITSIGLDHQDFLGRSIEEIAWHKAGIMKKDVPCTILPSIDPRAKKTIEDEALSVGAPLHVSSPEALPFLDQLDDRLDPHIRSNALLAWTTLCRYDRTLVPGDSQLCEIFTRRPHGRLQTLGITELVQTPHKQLILLDGAHNPDAWSALAAHVDLNLRQATSPKDDSRKAPRTSETLETSGQDNTNPVVWILAQSSNKHKSPTQMVRTLCRPGDIAYVAEFSPVDGMPWVAPVPTHKYDVPDIAEYLAELYIPQDNSLVDVLKDAAAVAQGKPIVVAGSLYLVGDLLRLLRERNIWEQR